MTDNTSLAELAGIENANTDFESRNHDRMNPSDRSSNSVASFLGSSIHPRDVASEEKWLELKSSIRKFCQGLGKSYCLQHYEPDQHNCAATFWCPILGELNFACLVGAALNDGRSYRPCVTIAPSKNCTSKQRKATKQILKANSARLVQYVATASTTIFDKPIQIDTVISES